MIEVKKEWPNQNTGIFNPYVDEQLLESYLNACNILETYKNELLKYNDTTSLKNAMKRIRRVCVNYKVSSRHGCMKYIDSSTVEIEISGHMLNVPKEELLTTMVHELLHCFKDSRGHKGNWKWRANIIKENTGLDIVRCRNIEEFESSVSNSKPIIRCKCKICGYIVERTSNCKFTRHPERFTHRHCGGHFERMD